MARCIPTNNQTNRLLNQHRGEQETLDFLERELSDQYCIYHGLHWTNPGRKGLIVGEADFIIVGPNGKVLLIEQKDGDVISTGDGLVKEYDGGKKQKRVDLQVGRALENLRNKFKSQLPKEPPIWLDYLYYFPGARISEVIGASTDRSRIVDITEVRLLPNKIEKLLGGDSGLDKQNINRVHQFFRQSLKIMPDINAQLEASEQAFVQLASGLSDVVNSLSFDPFHLRIQGTAGCGKSLLAYDQFKQAEDEGKRPLYVCFNRPLKDRMEQVLKPVNGHVNNFHGLCVETLESMGEVVDFSKAKSDPGFWDGLVDRVIALDIKEDQKFDTIIIDEGQDFKQTWLDVLELFYKQDHALIWLEDTAQNLQGHQSVCPDVTVTYQLDTSFRTPQGIAQYISRAHEIEFKSANPMPGLGVGIHAYTDAAEQERIVLDCVENLLSLGFEISDIAVLTCSGITSSPLYNLDKVGKYVLKKFSREYSENHQAKYTLGSLLFDSVHRFKGGQAPAVILVDVDPSDKRVDSGRPVVFCGMTRATARLDMVVKKDNPNNQVYLEAS